MGLIVVMLGRAQEPYATCILLEKLGGHAGANIEFKLRNVHGTRTFLTTYFIVDSALKGRQPAKLDSTKHRASTDLSHLKEIWKPVARHPLLQQLRNQVRKHIS